MPRLTLFMLLTLCAVVLPAGQAPETNGVRWTIVPGPFYNPNLGTGIQILPLVSYPLNPDDTVSPNSTTTGFLLFAKPDRSISGWTVIGGAGQQFYWKQDTWRASLHLGGASVVYQQYFAGNTPGSDNISIFAVTDGIYAGAGIKRRIWNQLYGGLNYSLEYYRVRGRSNAQDAILKLIGFEPGKWYFQSVPGIGLLWDSRDNQFAPSGGLTGELDLSSGAAWLGGSSNYALLKAVYTQYHSFTEQHVLAWAAQSHSGFGDVPRDKYNSVGSGRDAALRGYTAGEFEDLHSAEFQAEYRFMSSKRVGAAVFFGLGTVYGDSFFDGPVLPAGGFGLRLDMIPEQRIGARLDFAWGINSFAVYFALGEAF